MLDNLNNSTHPAITLYREALSGVVNIATAQNMARALDSLERFLALEGDSAPEHLDEALLGRWVAWMVQHGYSFSTAQAYVAKISALHTRAVRSGAATPTQAFANVATRLRAIPAERLQIHALADEVPVRLMALAHPATKVSPQLSLARDVLMMAIYLGGLSPEAIGALSADDPAVATDAAVAAIAQRRRSRSPYLFALRQGSRSAESLRAAITALWGDALKAAGLALPAGAVGPHLAADIWAECALRAGFQPAAIAGALAQTGADSPLMAFGGAEALPPEAAQAMRSRVGAMLQSDPDEWHALQMRPHVLYSTLRSRLDDPTTETLSAIFYPMEEIVRRTGRRTTATSRPVVPGLLFFRCRTSQLGPLFRSIGDLAWGYRTRRGPGAPYAVISPEAMRLFQTTIGHFDSDTIVLPAGTITPRPGDRIEIIGGDFIGLTATFDSDITRGGRTIYRLKLMGDNAIEWTLDADPRLTRPLATT